MLPFPKSGPLPTFEAFLTKKAVREADSPKVEVDPVVLSTSVEESAPPGLNHMDSALEAMRSEMTQAKVDALAKYDNAEQATQSLFDQACVLLSRHLKRELDEEEKQYAKERCKALCIAA
jgi:hypothetical protein